MAQVSRSNHAATGPGGRPEVTGWVGWIYFAGCMMLLVGIFHAIEGLVAIFNRSYYLVTSNQLVIRTGYTTWGWILLILGVLVAAAGLGVMAGQMWARVVGVVVAAVSMLANLAFVPAYPIWSILVITMDVLVIYALTVHGREAGV
jgi:hypothetical protein